MVNISDSNGEGAQAPSPFARVRLSSAAAICARLCDENRFFVGGVWL